MKFTFICVVTILSCSLYASGDTEFYSDLKYNLPLTNTFDDYAEDQPLYKKWPYRNVDELYSNERKRDPDYDFTPPEDNNFNEFDLEENYPIKNNIGDIPLDYVDQNRLEALAKVIEQYRDLKYKNSLNDVIRPYADSPDEDVTANRNVRPPSGEGITYEKLITNDNRRNIVDSKHVANNRHHHVEHPTSDEQVQGAPYTDVEESSPGEFAYVPPDPRFYDSSISLVSEHKPTKNVLKSLTKAAPAEGTQIYVNHRSGGKSVQNEEATQFQVTSQQQDTGTIRTKVTEQESAGVYIIAVVAGISAAATVGLIAIGIGWYNLQKHVKNASDVEYPAYGVTGPNKDASPSSDRRLAQSAQMYHYQHQKQQIIAMENRVGSGDRNGSVSEADSEEENEEGDYTVYECPGLAPTGEMEVKNPLFQDDPTPAQTPQVKSDDPK